MTANRNYSSTAVETALSGSISNSATSLSVVSTTGFPTPPFAAVIDRDLGTEEAVLVTAVVGLSLTVTRGYDSTAAVAHDTGAAFTHSYLAIDAREAAEHVGAESSVHGVTGNLVGATQTQTLTNKTLTSPTVNGGTVASATVSNPTLSGTVAGSPTFSGTVNFSGPVTADDITASGSVTVGTDVAVSGDLNVGGNIDGAPTVTGDPIFTGSPQFAGEPNFTDTAHVFDITSDDAGGPFGEWATYTPTLSSSTGTTPTIGSGGYRIGRYCKIGKTVHVSVDIEFGSSATQPGAEFRIGLPFTVNNATSIDHMGPLYIQTSRSAPNLYVGVVQAANGTDFVSLRVPNETTAGDWNTLVNGVHPLPFGSGENLRFSLTYEAA